MTTIRNLTPHAASIFVEDEEGPVTGSVGFGRAARTTTFRLVSELASEGNARANQSDENVGKVEVADEVINVVRTTFGTPVDLPEPQNGVMLLVSLITANAAKAAGRTTEDLLLTSNPVRDEAGKIMGCTQFAAL